MRCAPQAFGPDAQGILTARSPCGRGVIDHPPKLWRPRAQERPERVVVAAERRYTPHDDGVAAPSHPTYGVNTSRWP